MVIPGHSIAHVGLWNNIFGFFWCIGLDPNGQTPLRSCYLATPHLQLLTHQQPSYAQGSLKRLEHCGSGKSRWHVGLVSSWAMQTSWRILTKNKSDIVGYPPGWWFQPLWKILVSWGYYSQYMEKNKCYKPPTSHEYQYPTVHLSPGKTITCKCMFDMTYSSVGMRRN